MLSWADIDGDDTPIDFERRLPPWFYTRVVVSPSAVDHQQVEDKSGNNRPFDAFTKSKSPSKISRG